jgi:hypothetical protein
MQYADLPEARLLLQTIFHGGKTDLVRSLGAHEFGHFNLKSAFTVMCDGQLKDEPDQAFLLRQYYSITHPLVKRYRGRWVLRRAKESLKESSSPNFDQVIA